MAFFKKTVTKALVATCITFMSGNSTGLIPSAAAVKLQSKTKDQTNLAEEKLPELPQHDSGESNQQFGKLLQHYGEASPMSPEQFDFDEQQGNRAGTGKKFVKGTALFTVLSMAGAATFGVPLSLMSILVCLAIGLSCAACLICDTNRSQ